MGSFSERAIANRRCSERRKVIGRLQASRKEPGQGPRQAERPARGGTRGPEGRRREVRAARPGKPAGKVWGGPRNRQARGKASLKPIRPPDGTTRRCMFAGQWLQIAHGRKASNARQRQVPEGRRQEVRVARPKQTRRKGVGRPLEPPGGRKGFPEVNPTA